MGHSVTNCYSVVALERGVRNASSRPAAGIFAGLFQVLLLVAGVAGAQNVVAAPTVVANAGNTSVAVIFSATTTQAVNVLSFNVTFDPALCGMITNEKLLKNGRSQVAPQMSTGCSPSGTVSTTAPAVPVHPRPSTLRG